MQCPTCGSHTPGTLGKCSNCDAPIDVYSVGPLPAPVQGGPAAVLDGRAGLDEKTMMVPPPTPAWAPASPAPGDPESTATWTFDPDAEGYTPTGGTPALPAGSGGANAGPAANGAGANGSAANGQANGQGSGWANGQVRANGQQQPALGAAPSSGAPALPPAGGFPGGALAPEEPPPPVESIVPESWFAQPRKPDPQDAAEATQIYDAPQPPVGQGWGAPLPAAGSPPQGQAPMADAEATQLAPGPMGGPMGGAIGGAQLDGRTRMDFGSNGGFDQTRMDPGGTSVMGAPPMGPGGPGGFGPPGGGYGDPMNPGMPMGNQGMPMNQLGPSGPGGPGGPGGYPPGPARSGGGTSKPLLIGVAALVAVALVVVAFVAWPSGGGKDGGSPQASKSSSKPVSQNEKISSAEKQQAEAMSAVLDASVDARRVLAGALSRAGRCKDLPTAVQGFQNAVQRRQNQLNRTRNLKVGQLTKGAQLKTSLAQALQASLQVDQLLLQWAQRSRAHCHGKPKPDAAHVPGRAQGERRATLAKQKFVALWNPVAKKTGQPVRSWQRV
ncbi:hypothetical protein F8568_044310 [Actinomadura sp. LD22]|uniref:Uncharacterized protein n=1 Tax=Actinomadura physcomitrii TaxID=2650748 RepID=A0A6I4MVA1_9ACTN|nr:hypothetical protein [Actinomadura physcomitrii]MWA07241.1 hypothetical protein [Actinomadura physcomitrii]